MLPRRILIAVALLCLGIAPASAQSDELTLSVHRTFGYGSGSQIQGNFRLEVTGPADLVSVTFLLDDQALATDSEPPFALDFRTGEHPLGWHTFGANAATGDGRKLAAAPRRFEFVAADQALQTVGRIVLPLLAVVGLIMLVSLGVPMLQSFRGPRAPLPLGAPRRYGLWGGTICPKCQRTFARHWWAFNLVGAKLDRCDHCGRWSLVRALPPDVLARAEAAELAQEPAGQTSAQPDISEAEARRRALEESRFEE